MSDDYHLSLSLKLYELTVHPSWVTDILDVEPTSTRVIGEPMTIKGKNGARINLLPSKFNSWIFRTNSIVNSNFFDHWELIYNKIKGKEEKFKLINMKSDQPILSIDIWSHNHVPGIEIGPEILSIIARFGFRLDYDVV